MSILLNEEIFRRPETLKIDEQFDIIIKRFKSKEFREGVANGSINPSKELKQNLKNIENAIESLFAGDIILRFDDHSNFNKLDFGMCIYPSTKELHGLLEDAIENKGEGFYLGDCHNCLVFIDLALVNIVIKNDWNGRYFTSVLLHELGHKIYVKTQDDIVNGTTTVMVKIGDKEKVFKGFIAEVATSLIYFVFLFIVYAFSLKSLNTRYVKSEHMSDTIAVKYGYALEIYRVLDVFYSLTKAHKKRSSFNILFKFYEKIVNKNNTSRQRRDLVEELIKRELAVSDDINEKNYLKSVLKEVDNIKIKNEDSIVNGFIAYLEEYLKDVSEDILSTLNEEDNTSSEIYNEAYRFYTEHYDIFNEKFTLFPIDMDKANNIMTSNAVIKKTLKQVEKDFSPIKSEAELNPIQKKVIENKIKEIEQSYKTKGSKLDINLNTKIGIGAGGTSSETHLNMRNIVLMPLDNKLCIVEANDKGNIISITAIFAKTSGKLKFIRFQIAIFK